MSIVPLVCKAIQGKALSGLIEDTGLYNTIARGIIAKQAQEASDAINTVLSAVKAGERSSNPIVSTINNLSTPIIKATHAVEAHPIFQGVKQVSRLEFTDDLKETMLYVANMLGCNEAVANNIKQLVSHLEDLDSAREYLKTMLKEFKQLKETYVSPLEWLASISQLVENLPDSADQAATRCNLFLLGNIAQYYREVMSNQEFATLNTEFSNLHNELASNYGSREMQAASERLRVITDRMTSIATSVANEKVNLVLEQAIPNISEPLQLLVSQQVSSVIDYLLSPQDLVDYLFHFIGEKEIKATGMAISSSPNYEALSDITNIHLRNVVVFEIAKVLECYAGSASSQMQPSTEQTIQDMKDLEKLAVDLTGKYYSLAPVLRPFSSLIGAITNAVKHQIDHSDRVETNWQQRIRSRNNHTTGPSVP